jgi:hypothetical protein
MRVGVCDRDIIPPFRKLKFIEENEDVMFCILFSKLRMNLTHLSSKRMFHQ